MIQRIQTLYLALVLIFSFVGLITTSAEWTVADKVIADFGSFTFNAYPPFQAYDTISGPWCLGILLIIVIFLSALPGRFWPIILCCAPFVIRFYKRFTVFSRFEEKRKTAPEIRCCFLGIEKVK